MPSIALHFDLITSKCTALEREPTKNQAVHWHTHRERQSDLTALKPHFNMNTTYYSMCLSIKSHLKMYYIATTFFPFSPVRILAQKCKLMLNARNLLRSIWPEGRDSFTYWHDTTRNEYKSINITLLGDFSQSCLRYARLPNPHTTSAFTAIDFCLPFLTLMIRQRFHKNRPYYRSKNVYRNRKTNWTFGMRRKEGRYRTRKNGFPFIYINIYIQKCEHFKIACRGIEQSQAAFRRPQITSQNRCSYIRAHNSTALTYVSASNALNATKWFPNRNCHEIWIKHQLKCKTPADLAQTNYPKCVSLTLIHVT